MGLFLLVVMVIGSVVVAFIFSTNETENSNYSSKADSGKGSYGKSPRTNARKGPCDESLQTNPEKRSYGNAPIRPLTDADINKIALESLAAAKIITPYYKLLEEVLINNLKCLPKSVLEMEFTQTAIQVFILQYSSVVLAKKLSNFQYITTVCELVVKDLYEKGVLARKNLDPNLDDTNPLLRAMPMMIQVMSQYPPKNQTTLLIAIEKYMEQQLGHRVRYIGQRPIDNPLNK